MRWISYLHVNPCCKFLNWDRGGTTRVSAAAHPLCLGVIAGVTQEFCFHLSFKGMGGVFSVIAAAG